MMRIAFLIALICCASVKAATWPTGAGTYTLFESSANFIVPAGAFRAISDFSTLQTYLTGDSFSQLKEDDTPDPTDATWVHLTFILDNSTTAGDIAVYYDGVLQTEDAQTGSKTGSGNFTAQVLNIASRDGSTFFAAIDVDDFRIYSGALSQTEIEYVRDHPDE